MKNMEENMRAVEVTFTEEEMKEINETGTVKTVMREVKWICPDHIRKTFKFQTILINQNKIAETESI